MRSHLTRYAVTIRSGVRRGKRTQQRTRLNRPLPGSRCGGGGAKPGTGGVRGGLPSKPAEPQALPAGEDAQKGNIKEDEPKADKNPIKVDVANIQSESKHSGPREL